jgi:cell division GTPase FtsZ
LLNDNKITGAKNVLLLIVSGTNEIQLTKLEKSMIIFKLKQGIMPILSWGLVKTNH